MRKRRSGPRPAPSARLAGLALGVVAVAAVVVLVVRPTPDAMREVVAGVRGTVDDAGLLAPLAFVVVSAALTPLMVPGPLLAGASGLLFGTLLGFPLSLLAAVLGAALAFLIARAVGGDAVERIAGRRVLAAHELVSRRGFASILYARIAPGVPYSLVNYAAGLTRIQLATFAAATALGAAPRAFAYTALGGSLGDLRSPEAIAAACVLVAMALTSLGLLVRARRSAQPDTPRAY